MTTRTDHLVGAADPSGLLLTDIPCRTCGYNLRGLNISRLCPECAHPIAASTAPDLLRYASPRYLRSLIRGTRLIVGGVASFYIAIVLLILLVLASQDNPTAALFWVLVMMLASLLWLIGTWLLTTADPQWAAASRPSVLRKAARLTAIAVCALEALDLLLSVVRVQVPSIVEQLSRAALLFVVSAALAVQLAYLRPIALRIQSRRLALFSAILMWCCAACACTFVMARLAIVLVERHTLTRHALLTRATGQPPQAFSPAADFRLIDSLIVVGAVAAIVLFAALIPYAILLNRLGARFRQFLAPNQRGAIPAPNSANTA